MPRDKLESLEATYTFQEQRELLAQYQPINTYFVDWLVAMMWELRHKVSPFAYAARVSAAQKILEKIKPEHLRASQLSLVRVVRSLFPYDKLFDLPPSLARLLAVSKRQTAGKSLLKPPQRPLDDRTMKSPELVKQRYRILVQAFSGYALSLVQILREAIDEEVFPDGLSLAAGALMSCQSDLLRLKQLRETLYLDFPSEQLTSVSDHTLSMQGRLHRRGDLPREIEPELLAQELGKIIVILRGKLGMILGRAKEIQKTVTDLQARYFAQIDQLIVMFSAVQAVTDGDWGDVEKAIADFRAVLQKKFALNLYLSPDLLADLDANRALYKNGAVNLSD